MTDLATTRGALTPARALGVDDVTSLLQMAAADDKRTIGYAEKAAWASAAEIAGWTFPEAADAIRHHQATSTDYLRAAHITAHIRDHRQRAAVSGGVCPTTGVRLPSHAEALELWVGDHRRAGANPSSQNTDRAATLLGELLCEAPSAVEVLHAAVLAAREFSARIDWRLERIGRDGLTRVAPPVPVQYLPDDRLPTRWAARQPGFPAEVRSFPEWLDAGGESDRSIYETCRAAATRAWLGEHPDWRHRLPADAEVQW